MWGSHHECQHPRQAQSRSQAAREPARVAQQVPALRALMETRAKLRDLMSKVDRSEELEGLLEQMLKSEDELKSLSSQLGLDKKEG
jgi:type VI secretion system protein ImpB